MLFKCGISFWENSVFFFLEITDDVHPFEYYCMVLRTETGLMLETNLLKFRFVHEAFTSLFYFLLNMSIKKERVHFLHPLCILFVSLRKECI